MSSACLRLICDGQLEIVKITEDLYDATIEVFRNYFMEFENVSIACSLPESPETINEMMILLKEILKDNISFAARDVQTQELVSICINKLMNPSAHLTLDEVFASFETPNMKTVGEFLHTMEYTHNIFDEWQIDCVIELTFLCTRTEYGRRGIALQLANYLLHYATKLKQGDCTEAQELPEHLKGQKPQAITSVLTSRYSQVIAEKLGCVTLFKEENANFEFQGKTFAEKIDPQHKYTTYVAKKI